MVNTENMEVILKRENKVIYRDGDTKLKVFSEEFSKKDILNEAYNQACAEETGLPIPKILEVMKIDGKWAIRTEYIEGKTMTDLIKEHPEKEKEYIDELVDLQLEMLGKEVHGLRHLKGKLQCEISKTNLDATTRYELHTRLDSLPEHKKLCHGDFSPSNIVITPEGEKYIIDWSHATEGNGAADAARTFLLFALTGFSLSGNQEMADYYLETYCKKSDTAVQYVQKWIPIVAATQSLKEKEDEMELLLHWADVVDYE